jgi:hypothetical protein
MTATIPMPRDSFLFADYRHLLKRDNLAEPVLPKTAFARSIHMKSAPSGKTFAGDHLFKRQAAQ